LLDATLPSFDGARHDRHHLHSDMTGTEFAFPVEAGQVLQFARAIGDPNPVYRDPTYVTKEGVRGILAPPTYLVVADHFDPGFDRRPDFTPGGTLSSPPTLEATLHASQSFEYHRHLRAGDHLIARRLPLRAWSKQGRRGGNLQFVESVTECRDAAGELVVRASWVDVHTERSHAALSATPPPVSRERDQVPGESWIPVATNLSRTQIAMYVGAAGDFHPLHHDDVYARAHGYPGVFAPGMLTMAVTGRAVTDTIGDGRLTKFEGRFWGQVWPGDSLSTSVQPVSEREAASTEVELAVVTVNQHGATVFAGSAVARRQNVEVTEPC
jgi:acyl dehydratase